MARLRRALDRPEWSRMKTPSLTTALTLAAALASGCSGGATSVDGEDTGASTSVSWATVRAAKQAALDAYLTNNHDDYLSFKNAPLGDKGIPMVMFRLFPV